MSKQRAKPLPPRKARKQPGRPGRRKGENPKGKAARGPAEAAAIEALLSQANPGKPGAPRGPGRPPIELDRTQLVIFARAGCTNEEIADAFGVNVDTLADNYSEELRIGRADGKCSLRTTQMMLAERGNVGMLIWLGKQYLGQADKVDGTQNQTHVVKYVGPEIDVQKDLGEPLPVGTTNAGAIDAATGEPEADPDQSPIEGSNANQNANAGGDEPRTEPPAPGDPEADRDANWEWQRRGERDEHLAPPMGREFEEFQREERGKVESGAPSPEDGRR